MTDVPRGLLRCPADKGHAFLSEPRTCATCNRGAQAIYRRTRVLFQERYPDEYAQLREEARADVYVDVLTRI